ncbi:hypothetical protein PM082_010750 [Marasmius tenuissimus]|nr:hypothetical protein PM082_010750 [Marasmius tenuissimus]
MLGLCFCWYALGSPQNLNPVVRHYRMYSDYPSPREVTYLQLREEEPERHSQFSGTFCTSTLLEPCAPPCFSLNEARFRMGHRSPAIGYRHMLPICQVKLVTCLN